MSKKHSSHVVYRYAAPHFETIFNAAIAEKMLRAKFSYKITGAIGHHPLALVKSATKPTFADCCAGIIFHHINLNHISACARNRVGISEVDLAA